MCAGVQACAACVCVRVCMTVCNASVCSDARVHLSLRIFPPNFTVSVVCEWGECGWCRVVVVCVGEGVGVGQSVNARS